MQGIFWSATAFNSDISAWDVSQGTITLQQNFISRWTTNYLLTILLPFSSTTVGNMWSMFEATTFNSDISAWNVSQGTSTLQQDLISRWMTNYLLIIFLPFHLQTVTNMYAMFYKAAFFKSDISAWDVSQGTRIFATTLNIKMDDKLPSNRF